MVGGFRWASDEMSRSVAYAILLVRGRSANHNHALSFTSGVRTLWFATIASMIAAI